MAENESETRRMVVAVAISVALVTFVLFRVNLDFGLLGALLLALLLGGAVLLLLMRRLAPSAFAEMSPVAPPPEAPPEAAPAAPPVADSAPVQAEPAQDEPAEADPALPEDTPPSSDGKPVALPGPRGGQADDLKQIKGIGPKLEELLHGIGVYHFDQVAAFTAAEIAWIDDNLLGFKGRATRDAWVAQARDLAK